jgi:hypothetical protein
MISFIWNNNKCNSNKSYNTKGCYVKLKCHCQLLISETIVIMLYANRSLMMVSSVYAITLSVQSFLPNLSNWEVCKVQLLGSCLNNTLGFEGFFWFFGFHSWRWNFIHNLNNITFSFSINTYLKGVIGHCELSNLGTMKK